MVTISLGVAVVVAGAEGDLRQVRDRNRSRIRPGHWGLLRGAGDRPGGGAKDGAGLG